MTHRRAARTTAARATRSALSERERRFVESYMGASAGNATEAAIAAGYSRKTAGSIGSRLLKRVNIQRAIAERATSDPAVWTREERQRFWTSVASGAGRFAKASLRDRLRASELLGKSQADFVERHHVEAGASIVELLAAAAAWGAE